MINNITTNKSIRSPLFYVGDKYKLMTQLNKLFPQKINNYYDVFCGGGSASINVKANSYFMNDINKKIIELHQHLQKNSKNISMFIEKMYHIISTYGLSLSEKGTNSEIEHLKKVYIKTYFSKYNKNAYLKLRADYNKNPTNIDLLYLLLVYGFNHMIRFNNKGVFNLPVGNVDWNKNISTALRNYALWYNNNNIYLSKGMDFEEYIQEQHFEKNDFLYFDPPYLITFSEYNKIWSLTDEYRLYHLLDILNKQGIIWGLSNMISHKGRINNPLIQWSKKYNVYNIKSNYISRFDNTIKKTSTEIYVTNYKV